MVLPGARGGEGGDWGGSEGIREEGAGRVGGGQGSERMPEGADRQGGGG